MLGFKQNSAVNPNVARFLFSFIYFVYDFFLFFLVLVRTPCTAVFLDCITLLLDQSPLPGSILLHFGWSLASGLGTLFLCFVPIWGGGSPNGSLLDTEVGGRCGSL